MSKNLFEIASRQKFRFNFRGVISVEDLWDLSINDLDKIFKSLNSSLKSTSEESLLQTKTSSDSELEMKIDIIKYIFETKQKEIEAHKNAHAISQHNQKILSIISEKQEEELRNKSVEELQELMKSTEKNI